MPGGFRKSPLPSRKLINRPGYTCISHDQLLCRYSEVVKTLTKNANISKLITVECLDAVHHAVAEGKITSAAKGGMQYSIITKPEAWPQESKKKLSYILPDYFK